MTKLLEGSQDWKIATLIVEQNEHLSDSTSGCSVSCHNVDCDNCPMSRGQTLGEVRESVAPKSDPTYTGGSADYYQVSITKTTTPGRPEYIAECNDIIEALGMNFAEGNAFKAIWRRAAQRTLGLRKAGAKDDGLYDAEKVEFFGARMVAQSKAGNHDSE